MRQEIWQARLARARPLFEQGMTRAQVAGALSISRKTAGIYATRLGVAPEIVRLSDRIAKVRLSDRIAKVRLLSEKGITRQDAAAQLGVSYQTLATFSSAHGIEFRHASAGPSDAGRADTMMTMFRSGQTLEQIGSVFGVSRERVRQIIKACGGLVGKDGGLATKAARAKEARDRRRDLRYLAKKGCTYAQYCELKEIGRQMRASGMGYYRTPVGAFNTQRSNAVSRGIEWSMTLWDWWQVWQRSGKWDQRGRTVDAYVMCRYRDEGAYEPGNVYIASVRHNASVQPNNRYRASHPDHADFMASRAAA